MGTGRDLADVYPFVPEQRGTIAMIHLFCALPCEASPLIEHYGLRQGSDHDLFRLFISEDNTISLTLTGIGRVNAAAALSYHHACMQTSVSDIWLNVGVAGHGELAVGSSCLANKITEAATGLVWYPQIIVDVPCPALPLITQDTPTDHYDEALFDMEASGFYAMACRLGTAELIHVFKVISDNPEQAMQSITAAAVQQLIGQQLDTIADLLARMQPLADETKALNTKPKAYEAALSRWHFTETEKRQLLQVLRQWQLRLPDTDPLTSVSRERSAKTVIQALKQGLDASAFSLGQKQDTVHG